MGTSWKTFEKNISFGSSSVSCGGWKVTCFHAGFFFFFSGLFFNHFLCQDFITTDIYMKIRLLFTLIQPLAFSCCLFCHPSWISRDQQQWPNPHRKAPVHTHTLWRSCLGDKSDLAWSWCFGELLFMELLSHTSCISQSSLELDILTPAAPGQGRVKDRGKCCTQTATPWEKNHIFGEQRIPCVLQHHGEDKILSLLLFSKFFSFF